MECMVHIIHLQGYTEEELYYGLWEKSFAEYFLNVTLFQYNKIDVCC